METQPLNSTNLLEPYYFHKHTKMTDELKEKLVNMHEEHFENKRQKDFIMSKILYKSDKMTDEYREIVNLAQQMLLNNGITDFKKDKFAIEFHQRNCFGKEKLFKSGLKWHRDDNVISTFGNFTYSILFYIRKDKTVKGGDLIFDQGFKKLTFKNFFKTNDKKQKISEGDIMIFDGTMRHRPTYAYGFGCRDIVAVFIEKEFNWNSVLCF